MNKQYIRFVFCALVILVPLKAKPQKKNSTYKIIYVADYQVDCANVFNQKCFLIKDSINGEWKNFSGNIEGFNYAEGFEFKIKVKESASKITSDGVPSINWKLIKVLEKKSAFVKRLKLANKWVLEGFFDEHGKLQYDTSHTSTITFSSDEKFFTGNTGCNPMRGGIRIESNNKIKIGPVESLSKRCPQQATENKFIEALDCTTNYVIEGTFLILFCKDKPVVQLVYYME